MPHSNAGSIPFSHHHPSSRSAAAHGAGTIWRRVADGLRFAAEVIIEARALQARERLTGKGRRFAEW
jgi:hypothetical protein